MTPEEITICKQAINILRSTPYGHPYHAVRGSWAEAIETQMLVGYPEYDAVCVSLCRAIIEKHDPRTPEQRELDRLAVDERQTRESVRP